MYQKSMHLSRSILEENCLLEVFWIKACFLFISEIWFETGTNLDVSIQIQPISTPCINTNDPWSALVVKIEIKEATYGIYGFSFPKVWSTSAMSSIFYLVDLTSR